MIQRVLIIFLLNTILANMLLVLGQDDGDIWVMGYPSSVPSDDFGLSYWDFSQGYPLITYDLDAPVSLEGTVAAIASGGQLLMFTNGMEILDSNGDRIVDTITYRDEEEYPYWDAHFWNGVDIPGGFKQYQSAVILPVPGSADEYSVVYHHCVSHPELFFYRIVEVLEARLRHKPDNSWVLIYKDKPILKDQGFLHNGTWQACRHANGRDWWILIHGHEHSTVYRFLLDPDGFRLIGTQEFEEISAYVINAWYSPDGTKFAKTMSPAIEENYIYVYDFDRCSGLLSNQREIVLEGEAQVFQGITFSSNSTYLFASDDGVRLYQYDITAQDIEGARELVDTNDLYVEPNWFVTTFGQMMPGPDGRVYVFPTTGSSRAVHVIDRPNERGKEARLLQHSIMLQTSKSRTVQNFPNFRLGPIDGSSCDTLGINNHPVSWWRHEIEAEDPHEIRFTDLSYFRPEAWEWDFGDGESSIEQNPIHTYPGPELYHACLTVSNEYNSDSSCQWIDVMTVGTEESSRDMYSVFPNPFTDFIEIHPSAGYSAITVRILDLNGRVVHAPEVTCPCRLRLDHLPPGVYFYQIEENGVLLKSGKVVKM